MRIMWAIVLISGIAGLLPAPQSAWADETEQPRQLGVTVGMHSITTTYKISLATDETLKPGDRVNLYSLSQKKGIISGKPLAQDLWIADVVAQNLRVIAIDRSETPDPNQPYVLRMVRLEISPQDRAKRLWNSPSRFDTSERTIGLTGDYPPNICGDCIVLSRADYKAKYGRECSIRTRTGTMVRNIIIPCPDK